MKNLMFVLSFAVIGCSSMRRSVWLGAGVGGAAGAAAGSQINSHNRGSGALVGALTGAAIGSLTSYFIHKGIESREDRVRRKTLFDLDRFGVGKPTAKLPSFVPGITFRVEDEEFIPTHRKGNKVIEAHRIWSLSDNAQWEELEGGQKK